LIFPEIIENAAEPAKVLLWVSTEFGSAELDDGIVCEEDIQCRSGV
jgi:hypothetical protein